MYGFRIYVRLRGCEATEVLYAYLMGKPRKTAPKAEIPLHTVIKISWDGWQHVTEERFEMPNQKAVGDDGQSSGW